MSEELEALEIIKNAPTIYVGCASDIYTRYSHECKLIETALKRLEEHDKIFKKYDINDNWLEPALYVIKNHFPMDTETQLKNLKALEIIKNKKVNVGDFVRCKTIEDYNDYLCYGEKEKLTQEEYDLLKEVLL